MTQYRVLVKLANGSTVWTQVAAQNIGQARMLAEQQYTKTAVLQVMNTQ